MDPKVLVRGAAILQSIRACYPNTELPKELELFQICDDMEMYYEQIPHPSSNDPANVMLVWSRAGHVDERGCFGDRGMPHLSQRLMNFFVFATLARAREAQNAFEIPAHLQPWLAAWSAHRSAAKGNGDWTVSGGFIDDSGTFTYQMFAPALMAVKRKLWKDFGIRVQPSKVAEFPVTDEHPKGQDMVLLGLVSAVRVSQLQNDPVKATKYAALAMAIAEHADDHNRRAPLEWVDRCIGQFSYATNIDHSLKGDLVVLRDQVESESARQLGGQVLITHRAAEYLKSMATKMAHGAQSGEAPYVCFAPRQGLLGDTGAPIISIWTDASGSYAHKPPPGMSVEDQLRHPDLFYGWGAMYHVESDDTVYVTQQFTTYNARCTLKDSTAFEFFGITEAIFIIRPVLEALVCDISHVGDNASATLLVNGGSPHKSAERVLYWQHCDMRDRMPARLVVSSHVKRDFNQETDLLAAANVTHIPVTQYAFDRQRASIARLHDLVAPRFGRRMKIRVIAPGHLQHARERMTTVVRAKQTKMASSTRKRSILPSLAKSHNAYAHSPQARSWE
jgi:hypothetical protein